MNCVSWCKRWRVFVCFLLMCQLSCRNKYRYHTLWQFYKKKSIFCFICWRLGFCYRLCNFYFRYIFKFRFTCFYLFLLIEDSHLIVVNFLGNIILTYARRNGPLRRPTFGSCGGLYQGFLMLFWPIVCHFWNSVVPFATFSSNLNIEKKI